MRTIENVINYAEDKGLLLDSQGPKADTLRMIIKAERIAERQEVVKQIKNIVADGLLDRNNNIKSNIEFITNHLLKEYDPMNR